MADLDLRSKEDLHAGADSNVDVVKNVPSIDAGMDITDAENRKIRWKIDLIVLPCITIAMTLAFLDKNGLSYAAVWGIRADTNLVGQDYSWVASTFYFGYLAAEFPTMFVLSKVRLGKYVGCLTTIWGCVILCMAACHNFAGLVAVRVTMGVLEAGLLPAFMVMASMWWRKEEQALRTVFYFNTFAGVFGGILSYAIGVNLQGHSLAVWKYIFLIYGAITVFVGIIITLVLPDHPSTAWFLSAREKDLAAMRTIENQTGTESRGKGVNWGHIKEALTSPKYWTLMALGISQPITNAGVSNFTPLLTSQFGFSKARTTLMATPQAAVAMVIGISFSLLAYKIRNIRCLLWVISSCIALIGAVLIHTLDPVKYRSTCLAGVYLMGAYNPPYVLALSLSTSNTAGRTKKHFLGVSFAIFYAVGNLIGPQFFKNSESPRYPTGIKAMLGSFAVMAGSGVLYAFLCWSDNKRRDRRSQKSVKDALAAGETVDNNEADLTDVQNPLFRYSY